MDTARAVFASASYDQNVKLWDMTSGLAVCTIPHAEAQVNAMCLTSNGCKLAAGTWQRVRIFDVSSPQPTVLSHFDQCQKNVTCLGFEPGLRWMFSGGDDKFVRIFEMRGNQLICQQAFQANGPISSVALTSTTEAELIISDQTGACYIWDLSKLDCTTSIPSPEFSYMEFITKIAVHPNPDVHLVSAVTNRGGLVQWSLESTENDNQAMSLTRPKLKTRQPHQLHSGTVGLSCRYSPNGALLVSTFSDNKVILMNSETDEVVRTLDVGCDWNWDAIFSSDSRYLITGGNDGRVALWDVEKGTCVKRFDGHTKPITALCMADRLVAKNN